MVDLPEGWVRPYPDFEPGHAVCEEAGRESLRVKAGEYAVYIQWEEPADGEEYGTRERSVTLPTELLLALMGVARG